MGTISRVTTWSTGDTLTAADLNGEFDNILSTANGSLNADNLGVTAGIASALKAVVLDSNKDFADGTGSNQIRNLTISGSLKIGTTFLPDASGGADLGSSSLEWGDLYIADDKFIKLGSDQNINIGYDETTTDSLKIAATEGAALAITLMADEGDDAGDEWKLNVADGGTITLGNDIASAGTYVTHLTLTPHATVSSSTLALAGALTVAGTAGITGVATVGGLTIGSAVINEAELETIDGITAGTVAASKAVVVDSNKDIGTFRNITLNGTLSDGNYTFDTSGNVTGLGTVGSGAITSTGVVTGTGFTIGSAVINEAELETIDGVTAGTVAASKAVVVDSNKDIGSFRNITLTGELDGGSLDISGDADIDGTTNLDAVDIDGAVQVDATITVGADDQGYDVKFFGDTASAYLLWDTSADKLLTAGGATIDIVKDKLLIGSTAVTTTAAELNVLDAVSAGTVTASLAVVVDSNKDIGSFRNITLTGELDAGSLDISGDADIDGTANLDAVDIDGAVQIDNTVTVGVNGTGYDVKFFGDTAGSSVLWDQSADDLILTNAGLAVGSDATGDVYYRDANGFLARLAIGSDGQVLTSTGTLPNWEAAGGGSGGDFSGPGSSTDNAVLKFDGTGGKTGQNSGIIIDDSNNITGAANVTLSGELDAATGDFSGAVDIAGDLTLSAGADGALTFSAASSIKILDNSATSLVIEEADNAYMTFVTTNSNEAVKFDQNVGIGVAAPDGPLHVMSASAGTVTADSNADEFVIEGSANTGMTILSGSSQAGVIVFGDAANNNLGQFGYHQGNEEMFWGRDDAQQMVLDSSGNVGLGTTDPDAAAPTGSSSPKILKIDGGEAVDAAVQIVGHSNDHGLDLWTDASTGDVYIDARGDHDTYDMRFRTKTAGTPVNPFTITGQGLVHVGDTDAPSDFFDVSVNSSGGRPGRFTQKSATGNILALEYSGVSPDDNTRMFLTASDGTANRAIIYSDGDVWTSDAGTLTSDERLKTNIVDASDKLADLMQLRVRNYEWTPEYHPTKVGEKKIGFIAQELETVFPALISEHDIAPENSIVEQLYSANDDIPEGKEIGDVKVAAKAHEPTMRKAYKNAFAPILVKALQEVTTRLEAAEAKIAALESA